MKNEKRNSKGKKSVFLMLLAVLLLTITIGFATLSATLNINGTSKIKGNTWEIDVPDDDDIVCPQGQVCTINPQNPDDVTPDDGTPQCTDPSDPTTCTDPVGAVIWMDGDTLYFKHLLSVPGDVFTFTAKYTNSGSVDAKIASVSTSELNATAQQFLTYTATYADGTAVQVGDLLPAGTSKTFKITVAYKSTVQTLPTEAQIAAINEDGAGAKSLFTVQYEQK